MSELSITYRGSVYPWQCDQMGHLNVMWYVHMFDEANWQAFGLLGITRSFLKQHNRGMAGLQQNITYKRELYPGDLVTVRSGILEIKEKVVRFIHEMRNDETQEVAVCLLTAIHTDLTTRKSCPFPVSVLSQGQKLLVEYDLGDSRA